MSNTTNGTTGGPPPQEVRKRDLLPEPQELIRQRSLPEGKRPTLQEIADRYGTSRQAVYKRIKKYTDMLDAAPKAEQQ